MDTAAFIASQLAKGAWVTKTTVLAELVVLVDVVGDRLDVCRRRAPLRWIATTYVELLRGISALVPLFYMFFILPLFGQPVADGHWGDWPGADILGLWLGDRQVGAGQRQPGQRDALRALDFGPVTAFRRIILPLALPFMLPPLGNQLVELMKTTSLVSLITLSDLTFSGATGDHLRPADTDLEPGAAVLLVMAWPLSWLVRRYERHVTPWRARTPRHELRLRLLPGALSRTRCAACW